MLSSLSRFFKGQSYFKILEILSLRLAPVRLRTLAELSGMYVRSIELALSDLVRQKVVIRGKQKGRIFYSLNVDHPEVSLIREIFRLIADRQTIPADATLDNKAQAALEFSDAALELLSKVRR